MATLIKFPDQKTQHDLIIATDYRYRKYDFHAHLVKQMEQRNKSSLYTTTYIERGYLIIYSDGHTNHAVQNGGKSDASIPISLGSA